MNTNPYSVPTTHVETTSSARTRNRMFGWPGVIIFVLGLAVGVIGRSSVKPTPVLNTTLVTSQNLLSHLGLIDMCPKNGAEPSLLVLNSLAARETRNLIWMIEEHTPEAEIAKDMLQRSVSFFREHPNLQISPDLRKELENAEHLVVAA
jgi:hypothetical protein